MKIYIDNHHADNSIGHFFTHLEKSLKSMPGVVMTPARMSQVILCGPTSVIAKQHLKDKKVIQRLDGVYFNADKLRDTIAKNNDIKFLYERASGIIFQSKYSKNMVETLLGSCKKPFVIIHNGTDIKQAIINKAAIVFPKVADLKKQNQTILLAAASWRPVKRMKTLLDGFVEYRKSHPNTTLLIAGKAENAVPEGVICLGKLQHRDMLALYFLIDLLVNLSFSDACPNVVVEALYAKKPILATSNQGSSEVYAKNGYIIEEPEPWNYSLISYDKMPQIDPKIVAEGIHKALKIGYINPVNVSMDRCANSYKNFMFKVISGTHSIRHK